MIWPCSPRSSGPRCTVPQEKSLPLAVPWNLSLSFLPAVCCQMVALGLSYVLHECVTWGKYLFPCSPSLSFLICKLEILIVIEHMFTEGLFWQAMCWKLGMRRGVRLSHCPRVPWWLYVRGMEVGTEQAFRDGSSPVMQDL